MSSREDNEMKQEMQRLEKEEKEQEVILPFLDQIQAMQEENRRNYLNILTDGLVYCLRNKYTKEQDYVQNLRNKDMEFETYVHDMNV